MGESGRDGERLKGGTGGGKESVGGEAGAGSVGAPLVLKEAGVGIDVGELRGIGWAGGVGAVLRVGAVGVLRPETVEDEGWVAGALGGVGMPVAKLGRPGEVEEVVVDGLRVAGWECECGAGGVGARRGLGRWPWGWGAGGEEEKKDEEGWCDLLHSGSKHIKVSRNRRGVEGSPSDIHGGERISWKDGFVL